MWTTTDHSSVEPSQFGGDVFNDMWMNNFEMNDDLFDNSHNFETTYHQQREDAPPSLPSQLNAPMPSTTPLPVLTVDSLLSSTNMVSYSSHQQDLGDNSHDTMSVYNETLLSRDEDPAITATLDSFYRLDASQQRKVLNVIHERRVLTAASRHDGTWDAQVGYPVTPPAGKTDYDTRHIPHRGSQCFQILPLISTSASLTVDAGGQGPVVFDGTIK